MRLLAPELGAIRDWALKHKRLARALVVIAVTFLLAVGTWLVLIVLPDFFVESHDAHLTDAEELQARNDIRSTLLQAIGGALLLGGLYFTFRTFRLNEEGQVIERFTRAIDQVGSDKPLSASAASTAWSGSRGALSESTGRS